MARDAVMARNPKAATPKAAAQKKKPAKAPAAKKPVKAAKPAKSPTRTRSYADSSKVMAPNTTAISVGARKGRGRPTLYTKDIADEVIERLASGEPLARICRDDHIPQLRTIYDWVDADRASEGKLTGFSARFVRAREDGADAIAVECLDICDDGRNDWMERLDKDGQGIGWMLNGEHIQRSKLRIETRLRLLAKWDPKRYGDKIDLNHGGQADNPIRSLLQAVAGRTLRPDDSGSQGDN